MIATATATLFGNNTTLAATLLGNLTTTVTTTTIPEHPSCHHDGARIVIIGCYFILFCIGTVGNILVILSFINKRKRGSTIDLLILYLAFFDLLASIFTPFIFGYWSWTCDLRWDFGWFGCKVLPLATRIFTSVSIGILLIMAIDRYRVIATPFRKRFLRWHIHIAVGVTVILSFMSEIHYVNSLHVDKYGECAILGYDNYMYPLVIITLFRDTAFVTIFVTTTTGVLLRLYGKSYKEISRAQSNNKLRQKQKKRAAKMLIVMATVFGLTVIPRDLYQISLVISIMQGKAINYSDEMLLVNNILKLLQTSNSVYNVFIYARMSDSFFGNIRRKFSRSLRKTLSRSTAARTKADEENHLNGQSATDGDNSLLRKSSKIKMNSLKETSKI